jgi:hypothetical protein
MRMVRKQLYLRPDQEQKIQRLASLRRCTEAEVVREAIDRVAEETDPTLRRLDELRIVPLHEEGSESLSGAELAELERELDEWAIRQGPLGLTEAVLEDRR